jgi:molybdopterin-dependent oxidoreductase alpha subunit
MKFTRWRPSQWAGLMPNGAGHVKPNHYLDMLKTAWANRDSLPYAWRILSRGVCDGCALGTTGLRDFTMEGTHLCTVRLNLLRLNTMGAMDIAALRDVAPLTRLTSKELRDLGRLPYPMLRRKGEPGFARVAWDAALEIIAGRIRATDPHRISMYMTSRGITNEAYYAAQKAWRFMGSNNIDNSSRICHAPSTVALKETIGAGASTCSYSDWMGSDLLIFVGSDVPNNQPVTTKYLYYAKQQGSKVVVVNTYKEPGLERYWVPSVMESAVFGTKLTDRFFLIHTGGDIAFFNGVLKHLIEKGWTNRAFIETHTADYESAKAAVDGQTWETLERFSGAAREEMLAFAKMFGEAKSAVIVWSMGITQHRYGVENVKSLVNLMLAKGFLGKAKCGLMPIRGHSGVQGSAEMGAVPWDYPGGVPMSDAASAALEERWGFPVPSWRGLSAVESIDAAHGGRLDVLYSVGGNFLETLPEPRFVEEALARVPLRIHQDIVVTSQMLVEPADAVVLLPAQTRYEQRGGGTETSTERRVYYSPEIPGKRPGEAKAEFDIFIEIAKRARPEMAHLIALDGSQAIRDEIAQTIPFYEGIQRLTRQGDAFQWGGARLCEGGTFATKDGKAHFTPLAPPEEAIPEGAFLLSTRRGRQFNSMVQAERDPLTGARRNDVLMSKADADAQGVKDGDAITVRSDVGEMRGRCKIAPVKERNVQVHWPEGNVLLRRGATDPVCGIPDYNTVVRISRA